MIKLLRADFARLFKTPSYWICAAVSLVLCVLNIVLSYLTNNELSESIGTFMFKDGSNIMLFSAVFASIYIGTDYSCGTIRNKIIVGHKRGEIYLSNLIITSAGALIMRVLSWICEAAFGLIVGGKLGMPAGRLALLMTVSAFSLIAVCSVFTFIGMVISSKSTGIVASILTLMALVIGGAIIMELLNQPEFITQYNISINGVPEAELVPNPLHITGALRDVLTVINDVNPGGQAVQLEMNQPHDPHFMPLYSAGVTAVMTAVGLSVFRKKDLK